VFVKDVALDYFPWDICGWSAKACFENSEEKREILEGA
jgi:hypothetical protein